MGALICLIMAAGMLTAKDAGSPEELVKDVLQALQDKDTAALNDLAVTESEFKQSVWPLLTLVRGSRTATSYFKDVYDPTSRQVAKNLIAQYGGQTLQLVKITPGEPRQVKSGYRVYPSVEVALRDESGQVKPVKLFGSMVEHDGHFKVGTYYAHP